MANILQPQAQLDPQQAAKEALLQNQMGQQQGLAPRNGTGIMGALRGLTQRIQSVDPMTWALISSNIAQANQQGLGGIGSITTGVTQGLGQSDQLKSIKQQMAEQKEDREKRKFAGDQLSKSITESLNNLDIDADGVVSPAEKERGNILRAALPLARIDPERAAKMVQEASNMSLGGREPTADMSNYEEFARLGGMGEKDPTTGYTRAQLDWMAAKSPGSLGPRIVKDEDGSMYLQDPTSGSRTLLRGPESIGAGQGVAGGEKAAGEAAAKFRLEYPNAISSIKDRRASLDRIEESMRGLPTGPGGEILANAVPELQALGADFNMQMLETYVDLKRRGVTMTPMTDHDMEIIRSLAMRLGNYPKANQTIIKHMKDAAERIEKDIEHQMDFLEAGGNLLNYKGRKREPVKMPDIGVPEEANDGWSIEPNG